MLETQRNGAGVIGGVGLFIVCGCWPCLHMTFFYYVLQSSHAGRFVGLQYAGFGLNCTGFVFNIIVFVLSMTRLDSHWILIITKKLKIPI